MYICINIHIRCSTSICECLYLANLEISEGIHHLTSHNSPNGSRHERCRSCTITTCAARGSYRSFWILLLWRAWILFKCSLPLYSQPLMKTTTWSLLAQDQSTIKWSTATHPSISSYGSKTAKSSEQIPSEFHETFGETSYHRFNHIPRDLPRS